MSMKKLLLACALLVPTLSHAQIFSVTRTSNEGVLNAAIDEALLSVQADVNADLPSARPDRLMEGMADSQAAASKGLATDYISHFDTFMVGAGIGLGADLEEDKELDSDLSGAGVVGGLQLGVNMSLFADKTFLGLDPKKTTLMLNFFKYDLERDFDENSLRADLLSFGFMGSYRWIEQSGTRLFGWDGVRIHTGYQYSRNDLTINSVINETVNETVSGSTVTGTLTASPEATIETSSHSIPVEISSGVNFLWVLSFYGGLGTDFNMGDTKGKGNLNADTTNLSYTGGGDGSVAVETTADIDEQGKVRPLFLRGFAGFQVNLPYVRLYAHGNKVFGTEVYSLATGLRLAF
jgi:hypothetical protein